MNRLYQYKGITVSNGIAIVWNIFSALIVFNLVRQSKGFSYKRKLYRTKGG